MGKRVNQVCKLCVLFIVAIGLSACSSEAPKCSAPETIKLVRQIVKEELVTHFGQEFTSMLEIELNAIRTTDTNKKTGAQQCAAQLNLKGPGGVDTLDIIYTCELTDKDDEFYVTVYGL